MNLGINLKSISQDDPLGQAEVLRRIEAALVGKSGPGAPGSETDREDQPTLFDTGLNP